MDCIPDKFLKQFCDIAKVEIIHKTNLTNLATNEE